MMILVIRIRFHDFLVDDLCPSDYQASSIITEKARKQAYNDGYRMRLILTEADVRILPGQLIICRSLVPMYIVDEAVLVKNDGFIKVVKSRHDKPGLLIDHIDLNWNNPDTFQVKRNDISEILARRGIEGLYEKQLKEKIARRFSKTDEGNRKTSSQNDEKIVDYIEITRSICGG